jgi:hypothetical protein
LWQHWFASQRLQLQLLCPFPCCCQLYYLLLLLHPPQLHLAPLHPAANLQQI